MSSESSSRSSSESTPRTSSGSSSGSSAETETINSVQYIIDGTIYFIEDPGPASQPDRLMVWDANGIQIGELWELPGKGLQHVYDWVYRNLQTIYMNAAPVEVLDSTSMPSTPQIDRIAEFNQMRSSPMQSPFMQSPERVQPDVDMLDIEMSPLRQSRPDELLVRITDGFTAACMYYFDGINYMPIQLGTITYQIGTLSCATPTGLVLMSQLALGDDYAFTQTMELRLNPARILGSAFALTKESPDLNKRVVVAMPPIQLVAPTRHDAPSNILFLYIPQGSPMPAMTYRTDVVWNTLLIGQNCQQVDHPLHPENPNIRLTYIDPDAMAVEFLETLDNVHITGNLQIAQCPTERLIAARVATPPVLVTRIRDLADQLLRELPAGTHDLFRLPYVYEIDVQNNRCTKTPVNAPALMQLNTERGLSYFPQHLYDHYIRPHEAVLIQNMLFQMMFVYEKRGEDFKRACPPHKMLFDFYLRRDSQQVAFHYDRTAFFEVSTLSLLFLMPDGMTRPGPHIIPMPTKINPRVPGGIVYTDPTMRDRARREITRVCTFQVKNGTCVMCNNVFTSHSTPGTTQLFERGNQEVPWLELEDKRVFNFPPMHVSEEYKQKMERTKQTPRSFLRMWHVVSDPERSSIGLFGAPVEMFRGEFGSMIDAAISLQAQWFREKCVCLELTDYYSPTELARRVFEGRVRGVWGGRKKFSVKQTDTYRTKSLSVSTPIHAFIKTQNKVRALTMSSVREKIKRKMMQIQQICKNANQNVLIIEEKHKHKTSHKTSHARITGRGGSRRTRKVRLNKK